MDKTTNNMTNRAVGADTGGNGSSPAFKLDLLSGYLEDAEYLAQVTLLVQMVIFIEVSIGGIGNMIAFVVFCRKTYRKSSTAVYFRALSVFDFLCLLLTGFSFGFYDVLSAIKWTCFLFDYLLIVLINLSNWTLIIVTAERLCAILLPHRISQIMTKRNAYISLGVLTVAIMLIDSHDLFLMDEAKWKMCQITYDTEPASTIIQAFLIVHAIKFLIFPFPFITISNIIIIVHLRRHNKFLKSVSSTTTATIGVAQSTRSSVITATNASASAITVTTSMPSTSNNGSKLEGFREERSKKLVKERKPIQSTWNSTGLSTRRRQGRGLTLTLVALNVCFLLTRLPFEIHNISLGYPPSDKLPVRQVAITIIMGSVSLLNNTLNVFLYFATGTRFRREFESMMEELFTLRCRRKLYA